VIAPSPLPQTTPPQPLPDSRSMKLPAFAYRENGGPQPLNTHAHAKTNRSRPSQRSQLQGPHHRPRQTQLLPQQLEGRLLHAPDAELTPPSRRNRWTTAGPRHPLLRRPARCHPPRRSPASLRHRPRPPVRPRPRPAHGSSIQTGARQPRVLPSRIVRRSNLVHPSKARSLSARRKPQLSSGRFTGSKHLHYETNPASH
jgi:hypothetical protein